MGSGGVSVVFVLATKRRSSKGDDGCLGVWVSERLYAIIYPAVVPVEGSREKHAERGAEADAVLVSGKIIQWFGERKRNTIDIPRRRVWKSSSEEVPSVA